MFIHYSNTNNAPPCFDHTKQWYLTLDLFIRGWWGIVGTLNKVSYTTFYQKKFRWGEVPLTLSFVTTKRSIMILQLYYVITIFEFSAIKIFLRRELFWRIGGYDWWIWLRANFCVQERVGTYSIYNCGYEISNEWWKTNLEVLVTMLKLHRNITYYSPQAAFIGSVLYTAFVG